MKTTTQSIKIKIDTRSLTAADLDDIRRWDNEGGHPADRPDLVSSLRMPLQLHTDEIFEVVGSDVIVEDGQLYQKAEINVLSHH